MVFVYVVDNFYCCGRRNIGFNLLVFWDVFQVCQDGFDFRIG